MRRCKAQGRSRSGSPLLGRAGLSRRGFTLIEMLVAAVLVGIGLVAVLTGIGALTHAEARARDADLLQRLAQQKWEELGPLVDPRTADEKGDFSEQGHLDATWTMVSEPSGVENVEQVTVTATRGEVEQTVVGLVYTRPAATGATAATGGATP